MENAAPPVNELAVAEKIIDAPTSWGEKFIHLVLLDPTRTEVLIMWLFLAVLLVGIYLMLRAWDQDKTNNIVISDLVCIDGRISESKLARFGAFIISSWAFVFLIITEQMTEWFFMGYMAAWVSNAIFSKYIDKKIPDHGSVDADAHSTEPEPEIETQHNKPRRRR